MRVRPDQQNPLETVDVISVYLSSGTGNSPWVFLLHHQQQVDLFTVNLVKIFPAFSGCNPSLGIIAVFYAKLVPLGCWFSVPHLLVAPLYWPSNLFAYVVHFRVC
jgi:hypothetical protein